MTKPGRGSLPRDRWEDLDEEIRLHLELRVESLRAEGLSLEEARTEALRRFGGSRKRRALERAARRHETRMRLREWWGAALQDARFAVRSFARTPGFTALVVLTLALGIGASSTMFTLVESVLLRPLPFRDPHRLVSIWQGSPTPDGRRLLGASTFLALRDGSRTVEDMAAVVGGGSESRENVAGDGPPDEVVLRLTTPNYFDVLGMRPQLGRSFVQGEAAVVLGHRFWMRHYGGDPGVIGTALTFETGAAPTIVGVMGPEFHDMDGGADVWMPADVSRLPAAASLQVIARLRPGAGVEEARAELGAISQGLPADPGSDGRPDAVGLSSLRDTVTREARPALLALLGAVGLLLLIACANVANLLLGRGAARRHEIAIRRSLGAARGRVVRQLVTEGLVLVGAAGVLGLGLAVAGTRVLVRMLASTAALPRLDEVSVDLRVVGVTAGVCLLTGLAFGTLPGLAGPWGGPQQAAPTRAGSGPSRSGLRRTLVVAEIALALVLLTGAGLLVRSLDRLVSVDMGVRPGDVLTLRLTTARIDGLFRLASELPGRLEALPDVDAVGVAGRLPLTSLEMRFPVQVADGPRSVGRAGPDADVRSVAGHYFRSLGIPVVRGRVFDGTESQDMPTVFVINQTLASQLYPGQDPVGKRIEFSLGSRARAGEVIGVVGDVREKGPWTRASAAIYLPFAQLPRPALVVTLKTAGAPTSLADAATAVVHEIDPAQAVTEVRTLEAVAAEYAVRPRMNLLLFGGFAGLALLLSVIGLYGVVAHAVTQRRAELGVRIALGASRREVVRLVLGEGMRLALAGVALGLLGALLLGRLVSGLLFGVAPTDPLTLVAVPILLASVALVASWLPARAAARLDPQSALRAE